MNRIQSPRRRRRPLLSDSQKQQRQQLLAAAESLDSKLQAVESRLVSRALRNSDDKYFVEPYGAYLDLIWLNAEVGTGGGDVAGSADFAPTVTQLDRLTGYETDVAGVDADYGKILSDELPSFAKALESANFPPLSGGAGAR